MMPKPYLLLMLSLFVLQAASAQIKDYNPLKDTIVYYLKYPTQVVYKKEDADYFRIVLPPTDPNAKEKLFAINEYYPNGNKKLLARSSSYNLSLIFQGINVEYFTTGVEKIIKHFDKGKLVDSIFAFYPNGKIYYSGIYDAKEKLILNQCADSTGKILARNGNGYRLVYDENFKEVTDEGPIKDGLRDGAWHGIVNDSSTYFCKYSKGVVVSGDDPDSLSAKVFTSVEEQPNFKGGIDKFYTFLAHTIHYPLYARDHNIQGKVFVTFVVEKNGTLTGIKVLSAPSKELGDESMRVIAFSPPWIPGLKKGRPVRVQYTMPVNFALVVDK